MSDKGQTASEDKISARFHRAAEQASINALAGAAVGTLSGLVLFRSPILRMSSVSLGAGFGLGVAYEHLRKEFEKRDL